jgi:hypothetical protein
MPFTILGSTYNVELASDLHEKKPFLVVSRVARTNNLLTKPYFIFVDQDFDRQLVY